MNFDETPSTSGYADFMHKIEPEMLEKLGFPTDDTRIPKHLQR